MAHLKLILSPNALLNIQAVYRFLANKDLAAAREAIAAIRKKIAILQKFPAAGRPADDLDPEHRELLVPFGVSGYVVVYEIYVDYILLLAVRHQKESGY